MCDKLQPHLRCKIVCLGQLAGENGGPGEAILLVWNVIYGLQSSLSWRVPIFTRYELNKE